MSPVAKLSVPSSVSVSPSGIWTGTLAPTTSVASRSHREATREDITQVRRVGPDRVEVELSTTGEGGRVDLDLVEAHIVAGRQGRDIVVRHEEGQVEGAASGRDDAAGVDHDGAAGAGAGEGGAGGGQGAGDGDLAAEQQPAPIVRVSPLAKLSVPLSVSVWPSGIWTGTLAPTTSVASRSHREASREDITQVRRVGPDRVEVELVPLGRVPELISIWSKLTLLPAARDATSLYGTKRGTLKVLPVGVMMPPELTTMVPLAPVPVKVVPVAVRVPATAISAAEQQPAPIVTVSPVAKLSVPSSVSVSPSGIWTGTLAPTTRLPPDPTVKPFGKT